MKSVQKCVHVIDLRNIQRSYKIKKKGNALFVLIESRCICSLGTGQFLQIDRNCLLASFEDISYLKLKKVLNLPYFEQRKKIDKS